MMMKRKKRREYDEIMISILALVLMIAACSFAAAEGVQPSEGPVIGIAWRADTDSEFFTNICRAVEAAGGKWILLDQVRLPDLTYGEDGKLKEGVAETGALDEMAAKYYFEHPQYGQALRTGDLFRIDDSLHEYPYT